MEEMLEPRVIIPVGIRPLQLCRISFHGSVTIKGRLVHTGQKKFVPRKKRYPSRHPSEHHSELSKVTVNSKSLMSDTRSVFNRPGWFPPGSTRKFGKRDTGVLLRTGSHVPRVAAQTAQTHCQFELHRALCAFWDFFDPAVCSALQVYIHTSSSR